MTMAAEEGGARKKVFDWAIGVGREHSRSPGGRYAGGHPQGQARRGRPAGVHQAAGAVRRPAAVPGLAAAPPLSQDVAEFFHAAGILILEGYGLTETSAGTFVNRPDHYKLGTVGLAFPGTDVRLAEDGEVLLRGPGVMPGYHGLPEQTAEALTATAGCAPATSASSTPTASCASPTARRT